MLRPAPAIVLAGAAWTALVVAAPVLAWPALYAAAHLVCHQLPDRSLQLAHGPMAVCARCLGLYAGAVIGGAAAIASTRRGSTVAGPRRVRTLLVAAAVPTVLTVAAEWLLGWPVGNAMRFAAALPLGAAAAWVVARALEVDWRT